MNYNKNILIAEFTHAHSEILHSQIKFLKTRYNIHLLIHPDSPFDVNYYKEQINIHILNLKRSYISQIKKIIYSKNIGTVIFNTSHGLTVRNVCLNFLFSRIKFIGVLHESEKLFSSFTQKLISLKIKKYFVLSDSIKQYCVRKAKDKLSFESFYAIYLPYQKEIKEKRNYLLITIPGEISDVRRDYFGLIKIISENKEKLNPQIKFYLLGDINSKGGLKIKELIEKNNLQNLLVFTDTKLSDKDFTKYIQQADIIMPLLHPEKGGFKEYIESKISGAFNLAFAYHKPLLIHEEFKAIEDFSGISFFYNESNLIDVINKISEQKDVINIIEKDYSKKEKFSFGVQCNKYVSFIET